MPLAPLLTLAVESITPTADAKGVSLMTAIESKPVFVWADPDRLQQVFWNLLSNSVKFTQSGGEVLKSDEPGIARGRHVDRDFALANADHCYVMERGQLTLSGKPADLDVNRLHEALAV